MWCMCGGRKEEEEEQLRPAVFFSVSALMSGAESWPNQFPKIVFPEKLKITTFLCIKVTPSSFYVFAIPALSRSVHHGAVPIPNLCIELRGYKVEIIPNGSDGFLDKICPSRPAGGWSSITKAQPDFLRLQRTEDPDGSFAFVTPEGGMILVLAVFLRGGDYSTPVRSFPDHVQDEKAPQKETDIWRSTTASGSGRVEMHINLAGSMRTPEVFWGVSARLNDHSPCLCEGNCNAAAKFSIGEQHAGLTQVPATPSLLPTRTLRGLDDPMGAGRTPQADEIWPTNIATQDYTGPADQAREDSFVLANLLRAPCSNYGQRGAGLWVENATLCAVFRSVLDPVPIYKSLVSKTTLFLGKHLRNVKIWWIFWPSIVLGSIFFGLVPRHRLVFSFQEADGGQHGSLAGVDIDLDGCSTPCCIDNLDDRDDEVVFGIMYGTDGSLSQLAIAQTDVFAASENINERGGKSDEYMSEKQKGGFAAKERQWENVDSVFSSMFRAMNGPALKLEIDADTVGVITWSSSVVVTRYN